jgi:hypothetical protein
MGFSKFSQITKRNVGAGGKFPLQSQSCSFRTVKVSRAR